MLTVTGIKTKSPLTHETPSFAVAETPGHTPMLLIYCFILLCICEEFIVEQWRTQEFFSGGVQQIQLRTERTGIWGR